MLTAGVYDVVVYYNDYRGESASLIVRDDALIVSRHVLPRWAGDLQLSVPDAGYVIRRISIDGGAWLDVPHSTFAVPPHAPGTVDVTALTDSGKIITARSADLR